MKARDILIKAGTVLSAVLFLSAGLGFSSQAAAQSVSLKIPVKVSTSGAAPEETYTVTIERDPSNPNAPLPEPNQVSVKGTGSRDYILEFPEMVFSTEGEYKYTIKQTVGTQSNFTYDNRTYTLLVKTTEFTKDSDGNPVQPYLVPVFWVGSGENTAQIQVLTRGQILALIQTQIRHSHPYLELPDRMAEIPEYWQLVHSQKFLRF